MIVQFLSLSLLILRGVRPQQIAYNSLQGNLKHSVLFYNLVNFNGLWRNSPMYTKVLVINYTRKRQCVKNIHNAEVQVLIVFLAAFLVKVETLSHLTRFVVASQHKNVVFVLNLHCHQKNNHLHSKRSTIDVISQKEDGMFRIIVDVWTETENFE